MIESTRLKILVVENHGDTRRALAESLESAGLVAVQSPTASDARSRLQGFAYDGLVVDVRLPDGDGLDLLDEALARYPTMRCVVTAPFGSVHHAVRALKRGAVDYLIKPLETARVAQILNELATSAGTTTAAPAETASDQRTFQAPRIIGWGADMARLFSILERVSPTNSTVLIQGETGTGKEVVARTIHENSPRRDRGFVAFNAAAIPEGLAEAELFGHAKGAFTGAIQARVGRFELADQGTIFIDELSSMPLTLQAKLLRVLQEREIERVGTSRAIQINTRVIAASNVNVREMVKAGTFREDLFYRLNVVAVNLPPLRGRQQDIATLACHFVRVSCRNNNCDLKTFSQPALQLLMEGAWPGNVRHLQNVVEHAVAMSGRDLVIRPDALPDEFQEPTALANAATSDLVTLPRTPDEGIDFVSTMNGVERTLLLRYLDQAGGNKRQAARLLSLSRTTLTDKLHRLGISEPQPELLPEPQHVRAIA